MPQREVTRVDTDSHIGHASSTPNPFHQTAYKEGSSNVITNGKPTVRIGDETYCGDPATGEPIGDSKMNLRAAIAGETHEYTDMYPGMAKTARDEGFDEVADWFETLAKAERSHANRFTKALENMS